MKRYYFDEYKINELYPTLWDGYIQFDSNKIPITDIEENSNRELDDLVTNICAINFYIYILDSKIYISLCQDSVYYFHQFEKDIKKLIFAIEDKFKVNIDYAQFNATEVKHQGNQYKYTLTKDTNNRLILKKKILNWDNYSRSKKLKEDFEKLKL
jgi:hypothetical protein